MTNQQQLKQKLWDIANDLRGKLGADEFRDYMLGFIFFKFLSEKMLIYSNKKYYQMACTESRPSLLKAHKIGSRIIQKMRDFVDVFVRGMVG